MHESILCIRSNVPGTDQPDLRTFVTAAEHLAGRSLAGALVSVYDHEGFLFITWSDSTQRESWSGFVAQAAHDCLPGAVCYQLVPGDQDTEFDDEALSTELEP